MIVTQRRQAKPVFGTGHLLDIRIGVVKIAVAHYFDHIHAGFPIELQMLLYHCGAGIFIRRKMVPEAHGDLVYRFILKCF